MGHRVREEYTMLRIENIKGIIWDLDGVLHAYRPFEEALSFWDAAAVRAFNKVAAKNGIDHGLSPMEAQVIANNGFKRNGFSISEFIDIYNLDPVEMLVAFHNETDIEHVMKSHDDLPEALRALSEAKPDIVHVINTHGPYTWAERTIEKDLRIALGNPSIISLERGNMEKKSATSRTFYMAANAAGLPPESLVMVEDTVKNLAIPKREGAQTVFIEESGLAPNCITYPYPEDTFVDASFKNATLFVQALTNG